MTTLAISAPQPKGQPTNALEPTNALGEREKFARLVVLPGERGLAAVREPHEVVLVLRPISQNTDASLIRVTVLPGQWPEASTSRTISSATVRCSGLV